MYLYGSDERSSVGMYTPENDYDYWVYKYDSPTILLKEYIDKSIKSMVSCPCISIIMPVYKPKVEWLKKAIKSIVSQSYPHWVLCISDDCSMSPAVKKVLIRYANDDPRIRVIFRKKNGHISAASNTALDLASGDWVALMDQDDMLAENALFWVAQTINDNPEVRLIYSDEDKIDENDIRTSPYFKSDWNYNLFLSHNLISHLSVYYLPLVRELNGFRKGLEGAQDYDLALRFIEVIEGHQIYHIPRILYHWRMHPESTAQSIEAKPYAISAGKKAIEEHFARSGINAQIELTKHGYRAKYKLPRRVPLVSLIIPTRNGIRFIKRCVDSILSKTTYPNFEIIIIDNNSDDLQVLSYFKSLSTDRRISIYQDERPFNYSALNNFGARIAKGDILGLLNNDLEVINPGWLSEMVSHALRKGVGAVGAKLWYPNNTLQHGGVVLGIRGWAGHSHKGFPKGGLGYGGRMHFVSEFSAVTGACLLVRKSIFEQVGGLNEKYLKIAGNDIDLCLKLLKEGYKNVWTPHAELYHHESATRGYEDTPEKQLRFSLEIEYVKSKWGRFFDYDPSYSPNLTLDQEDFSYAWPPRIDNSFPRPDGIRLSDSELYSIYKKGQALMIDGRSRYKEDYPSAASKKGLHVECNEDVMNLGIKHSSLNLNLSQLIDPTKKLDGPSLEYEGSIYHFNRQYLLDLDSNISVLSEMGVLVNLTILSFKSGDPVVDDLMLHPNAVAIASSFNIVTDKGRKWFIAAMLFISERWSRPDQKYGRVVGYIIGNEVNCHWWWSNMGRVSMREFADEYVCAVRLAHGAVRRQATWARIYISLDHHWNSRYSKGDDYQAFPGKDFINYFASRSREWGDFDWHLAYHPYSENLHDPRFWKDESAMASADTPRITSKNLEVLTRYLCRKELQYNDIPRRVILSEQGFNTPNLQDGERIQAAAFCYSYKKVESLEGIDAFILHRHIDSEEEGGLMMGLRRQDENRSKKKIYDCFRLADTPKWEKTFKFALPLVGLEQWEIR